MAGTGVTGPGADEKERLDAQDIAAGDLLAATHLHRYELASQLLGSAKVLDLCCGTGYGSRVLAAGGATVHGVDLSADAVQAAKDEGGAVTYEQGDALEYLRGLGTDDFEAVVCFEGIEHVPDPQALATELARLAEGGVRLVLSVPNSRGFEEHNRYHLTDFGWEETQALIARFAEPIVLQQRLLEGSLIVPTGERPPEAPARLFGEPDRDDAAWAGHWLVLVGADPAAARTASARLAYAAAAHQSGYVRDLEQENQSLWRENNRLARGWLGVNDAAAGSVVRRLEEALPWKEIADQNDYARQGLQRRLDSPPHRLVDAAQEALKRVPGFARVIGIMRGRG